MKINIYGNNLRDRVEVDKKTPKDTGVEYTGLQFYIAPDCIHGPDDDDTSAVVFWYSNKVERGLLKAALERALKHLNDNPTSDDSATQS